MCKAFSGVVLIDGKVHWKFGMDSHSDIIHMAGLPDNTADPAQMQFAKFEITPKNGNYLFPDEWVYRVDESPVPRWCGVKHEEAAHASHKKWLAKLNKILVRKKIVNPFQIAPPKITKQHINMLRKWASVGASVWESVWDSVGASVRASVGDSVWDSVGASVWDSVRDSVWDSVGASVRASVGASVGDSVWDSVGASVWDSVRASVWDSVRAYTGSFFMLPTWKYVKHPRGKYPFAPAVKLWEKGLVPSFDGKTWRLHGGPKAAILFEISTEELRGKKVAQ